MFDVENIRLFLIATLLVNLAPGSDMLFVVSKTLSHGTRGGYLSTFGVSLGCLFHIVLASAGLSAVIMKFSFAYDIIKYAGALYLVYLGVNSIIRKKRKELFIQANNYSNQNLVLQGILTDILNPKVAVFFLAFLPQFVSIHSENKGLQFLFLGILFNIIGTAMFFGIVFLVGKTSSFMKNSTMQKYIEKISGIALIGLGISIAIDNKK